MRYVVGIDIGGTNLVVGCVAEDGSALHGLMSEPTRPETGRRRRDGAPAHPGAPVHRRHACASCRRWRSPASASARPARSTASRGMVLLTPEPRLGEHAAPRPGVGGARPARRARQRRQLRRARRVVDRRREGRAPRASASPSAPASAAASSSNGEMVHGASDCAGEIGHITIETEGRRCKCGNYGCLEAYASGPAIARRAVEEVESGGVSRLAEFAGGSLLDVTAQTVYEAANHGDVVALAGGERDRQVPRRRHREPGERAQSRGGGGVRRRDARGRRPLRAASPRGRRRAFRPAVEACRIVPGVLTGTAGVVRGRAGVPAWTR